MAYEPKTVTIEDARLMFKNFTGREDRYNTAGERNFAVVLPDDIARQMEQDRWNVKWLDPRDEGDSPTAILPVAVSYKIRPPRITMRTSVAKTIMTEDMVETLDYADIRYVDLIVRGRDWENNGRSGVKAYLQTMFVTVQEDELEHKYALLDAQEEQNQD